MNTVFMIDGGIGRVITSIPALHNYHKQNPHDDFSILASHPLVFMNDNVLHNRVLLSENNVDIFKERIRPNAVLHPEPYHDHQYFNNQISLHQAFNKIINNTNDHSDLQYPVLTLSNSEIENSIKAKRYLQEKCFNKPIVVFQPFGESCFEENGVLRDHSGRSMSFELAQHIVFMLSKKYCVYYFGPNFHSCNLKDVFNFNDRGTDIRFQMQIISQSAGFIGIDSCGQHISHAFKIPSVVFLGATVGVNVSYPNSNYFYATHRQGYVPEYIPFRICDLLPASPQILSAMDFTYYETNMILKTLEVMIADCNRLTPDHVQYTIV